MTDKEYPGKISGVIPATRIPAGSRWQHFLPPQLAYGEKGVDDRIGPDATLVFEVELVSVR